MSYKVNDRVRVSQNIREHEYYGKEMVTERMMHLKNKVVTISDVIPKQRYYFYKIIEDNGEWFWTDDMFEQLTDSKVRKSVQVVLSDLQINKLCKYYNRDVDVLSDSDIKVLHDKFLNDNLK